MDSALARRNLRKFRKEQSQIAVEMGFAQVSREILFRSPQLIVAAVT
jgi:hypothetical protein